ncbi:MAG TPA: TraR/DksA C4-type zinc finger protein [Steroidobacteraceae bacterium]|nr:TraR/DksA C4-type zinc finger protein [Steroidobacteraceae bacterium]
MNEFDRAQALDLAEIESRQARARLPDVAPVDARDCEDCGDAIAPARLRAYPHSVCCIGCATRREHKQRIVGGKRG